MANRANRAAIAPMVFGAMEGKAEKGGGGYRAPPYFLKAWGAMDLRDQRRDGSGGSLAIAPRNYCYVGAME